MDTTPVENESPAHYIGDTAVSPTGKSIIGNDNTSSVEDNNTETIKEKKDESSQPSKPPQKAPPSLTLTIPQFTALLLAAIILTVQIVALVDKIKYKKIIENQIPDYCSTAMTVEAYLRKYYIGEIDNEHLEHALAAAVLEASGDAYAHYYTPEEYSEELAFYNGHEEGIGIHLTYREGVGVEVNTVIEDAPAKAAGILKGDVIIKVNGADVGNKTSDEINKLISGEPGTAVEITVSRDGLELTFNVIHESYVDQTVANHLYLGGATAKKIGVIQVSEFTGITTEQIINAINELSEQGAEALVFDMRNNRGGTLDSVVSILDRLLPEGIIVRITDRDGKEIEVYNSDSEHIDIPMAVLTNGRTASAAELFTAALKDYGKAVSVGTVTYGKGTMQKIFPLPNGGAFKFSYRYYSPPISDNYDGEGVLPDIKVEPADDTPLYYLDDNTDVQLKAAAEHLIGTSEQK